MTSKKALSVCSSLTKGANVNVLRKLFPSSASTSASLKTFDPSKECIASRAQSKKKKAVRAKPSKLNVILLKDYPLWIPKGKGRKEIDKEGRLKQMRVIREMSSRQVKEEIMTQFVDFSLTSFIVFESTPSGRLIKAENQSPSGTSLVEGVCKRKVPLYIFSSSPEKVCTL